MLLDIKNFFYQKYYRDLSAISFASLIVPLLNAIIVIPLFIVNWGVDKYGEWIIYQPIFNKNNFLLWALPYALFICGGFIIFLVVRKTKHSKVK